MDNPIAAHLLHNRTSPSLNRVSLGASEQVMTLKTASYLSSPESYLNKALSIGLCLEESGRWCLHEHLNEVKLTLY